MSVDNPYEDDSSSDEPPVGQSLESDLEHVKRIIMMALTDVDEDSDIENEEFAEAYRKFAQEADEIADDPRVAIMGCWRLLLSFAEAMN